MSDAPAPYDAERARAVVDGMLAGDAFSRWLGVRLIALDDGSCSVGMTVREEMVNGFAVVHGGIAYSLADSAMAFACNGDGAVTVAVENGVSYPAPIHPGDELVATARRAAAGGRLGWYHVEVRNQHDSVVCLFRGTVYRTRQQHPNRRSQ